MLDREAVTDAIKFWERGRIVYNLALLAVTLGILVPAELDRLGWYQMSFPLLLLAVIANVLYCVVYPVDLLAQASDFRAVWRTLRWGLLAFGVLFGAAMAFFALGGPHIFAVPGITPHG